MGPYSDDQLAPAPITRKRVGAKELRDKFKEFARVFDGHEIAPAIGCHNAHGHAAFVVVGVDDNRHQYLPEAAGKGSINRAHGNLCKRSYKLALWLANWTLRACLRRRRNARHFSTRFGRLRSVVPRGFRSPNGRRWRYHAGALVLES